MPNGQGITKQTFIESDEATTKAMTYDLLHEIYNSVEKFQQCHKDQQQLCEQRFKKIESSWSKLAGALIVIAALPGVAMLLIRLAGS